jgi:hypothetical protein
MTEYPIVFPQSTNTYDDMFADMQSDRFIASLLSGSWDISTYEGVGNPANIAKFNLLDGFKLTDTKLTWFTYVNDSQDLEMISRIKQRMLSDNKVVAHIDKLGVAFLLLVPGAHLQEHIDQGEFGGTSLIFPIMGKGVFTYNKNAKRYIIDRPTFVDNTVWHNFINTSSKLVVIMTISLPISNTKLKDITLQSVPELE